ncbi:MAG: hypothetical protein ACKO5A_04005 [Actinomycetota bacterium]
MLLLEPPPEAPPLDVLSVDAVEPAVSDVEPDSVPDEVLELLELLEEERLSFL